MLACYETIAAAGRAEIVEKRSRFLGLAAPVATAKQAAEVLAQVKAEHYDARHHCWAYRLRDGAKRYSDDGEPQGTAGLPILDVLERQDVTDCLIVVTRYFGGTLLGTGGLVRAYSAAAGGALGQAVRLPMALYAAGTLTCDYSGYGRIPALIARHEGLLQNTDYGAGVTVTFLLPQERQAAFQKDLRELTLGSVQAAFSALCYAGLARGQWHCIPAEKTT